MSAEAVAVSIPPGYKQTEVGVIPEDWHLVTIGDFAIKVGSGITPRGGNSNYKEYGRPFVRSQNVGWGTLLLNDLVYIDDDTHKSFSSTELQQGDVLLNITGASIGRSAITETHLAGGNVNQHVCIIRTDKSKAGSRFLNYIILSSQGQRQIDSFQAGGNREGLNFGQIRSIRFPLPPTLAEQEAIALALYDTDALIESLKQLIAKKRQIKQGAMQELLSPTQDDNVRLLKEVSSLKGRIGWQGLKQTEFTTNEDEPFLITGMNFKDGAIRWNEVYHISEERYEMATDIQLRTHDVLMTKDGTIGKVLYIDMIPHPEKASLNSHLLLFRPIKDSYSPKYLYYQLCSKRFKQFIDESKSGTTFFGLSQEAVGNYPVLLPPMEKQVNIASVLSDMDSEITSLEEKLAKTRQLKQGMMQELLTGRIRLV